MYESFYGFSRRPFTAIPDADSYVPLATSQEAVAELLLCVQQGDGIAVLTAPAGLGKSLLCRHLAELLREEFEPILLPQAGFDTVQSLLQSVLYELGTAWSGMTENEMRLELKTLLAEAAGEGQPVVLIIDEAHLLQPPLLEEIRCLANLEHSGRPQARIVLSGQLELEETLAAPGLEAFNQRVRCQTTLPPLSQLESAEYLLGRLQQAGTDLSRVFSREAVQLICRASDGNPRCLNQLSDQSLLLGYIGEEIPVGEETVRDALDDLRQLPLHWNIPARSDVSAADARDAEPTDTDAAAEETVATGDFAAADSDVIDDVVSLEDDETGISAETTPQDKLEADGPEAEPPAESACFEVGEFETGEESAERDTEPHPTSEDPAAADSARTQPMETVPAETVAAETAVPGEVAVFECGAGDSDSECSNANETTDPLTMETADTVAGESLEIGDEEETEPAEPPETQLIVSRPAEETSGDSGAAAEVVQEADDEEGDTHCIEFGLADGDEVEDWATGEWTSFDSRTEADELAELLTFDSHQSAETDSVDFGAELAPQPPAADDDEIDAELEWELQLELAEREQQASQSAATPVTPVTPEEAVHDQPEDIGDEAEQSPAAEHTTVIHTAEPQSQDLVLPAGDGWQPVEAQAAPPAPQAEATTETPSAQAEAAADESPVTAPAESLGAADSDSEYADSAEGFADSMTDAEAAVESAVAEDLPEDDLTAEGDSAEPSRAEEDDSTDSSLVAERIETDAHTEADPVEEEVAVEMAAPVPADNRPTAEQPVMASMTETDWEPVELRAFAVADRQQQQPADRLLATVPAPAALGPVHEVAGHIPGTGTPAVFQEQEVLDPYARLDSGRAPELSESPLADALTTDEISQLEESAEPVEPATIEPAPIETAEIEDVSADQEEPAASLLPGEPRQVEHSEPVDEAEPAAEAPQADQADESESAWEEVAGLTSSTEDSPVELNPAEHLSAEQGSAPEEASTEGPEAEESPAAESFEQDEPEAPPVAGRSANPLETLDRASRLVEEALHEHAAESSAAEEAARSETEDLDEAPRLTPLYSAEDELEPESAPGEGALPVNSSEAEAGNTAGPANLTADEIAGSTAEEHPLEEQIGRAVLETSFDAQRVVEQRLDQMIAGQRQAHRPEVNDWEPVVPASGNDDEQPAAASPPFDAVPLPEETSRPASSTPVEQEQLVNPFPTATASSPEELPRHEQPAAQHQPELPTTRRRFARLFTDLRQRATNRPGRAG
ncbi:MAG: AAA family ATPase [Planctomycetaceae bacterium]|nr:AAA family ATPase [Planctomycetaceae bacterium]